MSLSITPGADFTTAVAGRLIPFFATSGNRNMPIQSALFKATNWRYASALNAGIARFDGRGASLTGAGTAATVATTTTNLYTVQNRSTHATVVTTLNQQVGSRRTTTAQGSYLRGSSAGQGGFFMVCRFGTEVWTAGDRLFVGLAAATSALCTGDPSAIANICGFGIDAADSAITFMHNDGSGTATKDAIAGQPTLASNQGYDAYIFCKPNDSVIYYRLDDTLLGTTIINSSTNTDMPVSSTFLMFAALMGNAANTAAGAATIGEVLTYIETDR